MFGRKSSLFIIFTLFCSVIGSRHHRNNNKNNHHKEDDLISTKELRRVSEELFDKLSNSIYQYVNINYQGERDAKDAKDEAPEPLFIVPRDLFETVPTIQNLRKLYDNYEVNSLKAEEITAEESAEEDEFIDSLLDTNIIMHTMDFLAKNNFFPKNLQVYKDVLKKIWFHSYARSNSTNAVGSSGFEHVFLVEKKRSHITGLHNWLFFASEEYDNKANYLGYIKKKQLADKAAVIKFYLSYLDKTKLSSMFIGTPPEFDVALYTLCFFVRPNRNCNVLLGGTKITIQAWIQKVDNDELVCSAYPKIY